tara:strand:+ start:72 stop:509 length:438 start_codon:yes stop_codon:yes gene_type:complete
MPYDIYISNEAYITTEFIMSLDWNITKLDDSFAFIICNDNHPLHQSIINNGSDTWFLDDDGSLKCMNPFVRFMIWETLAAKCNKVTKSNVNRWMEHLKNAYLEKDGIFADSAFDEIVAVWTDEGWIYRSPTEADIINCIGLKTNA